MALDTFGGGVSHPSDISFRALSLTESLTLQWPNLSASLTDVAARIMEVTPTGNGLTITLPDATQVGTGQDILFRNLGFFSFTVLDGASNSIGTVGTGDVKYFYLTSNTSAAGAWSAVNFGAGASNADSSLLAGMGLKAITTTLNQKHDVVEVASSRTINSTDRAKTYVWTSGSHTCSLPTSSSVGPDFFFIAKNGGAGTIDIDPSGVDLIDNATSLQLAPNDGVIVYSAGNSNKWYTIAQGRPVQFAFTQLTKNVTGIVDDITLTASEAANKLITFSGTLTGNMNIIVPSTVSVYYILNNTTGNFTLTVKTSGGAGVSVTQGAREIVVCDGADVRRGMDNTSASTLFSVGSEAGPTISFVTDPNTGFYHPAENQVAVSTGGVDVMRWNHTSGSVNALEVFPSTTGNPVQLIPYGDDANSSLLLSGKGTGQVLINDEDFAVRDGSDTTKKLQFQCSSVTTNTTRTVTVANASGTMTLNEATQILTNKTLTTPVISSPSITSPTITGTILDNGAVVCPTGVVLPYAGTTEPTGWLFCFGQEVSRSGTTAVLFSVLGTTFGAGNGATTFNLPDCRGRVIAGKDNMGGTSANRLTASVNGDILGNAAGLDTHVLTVGQMPTHAHGVTDPTHSHGSIPNGQFNSQGNPSPSLSNPFIIATSFGGTAAAATGITLQNTGGGGAHDNVQPTIVLNMIIKT